MPTPPHILIDTYNLRLRRGSGIKTYGRSLIDALDLIGSPMSFLTDRNAGRARTRALEEVLLHDYRPPETRFRRVTREAVRGIKRTVMPVTARAIRPSLVIPDAEDALSSRATCLHNVPGLYDQANLKYKRFKRLTTIALEQPVDIFHATTPLPIRVRGAKLVTTIHDLIPLKLPYTTLDDKRFFHRLVRDAIRDSDLILTISECTRRDIVEFFNVPEEKIHVPYQALPERTDMVGDEMAEMIRKRFGLEADQYLLFVGNIEPKKNVKSVIKAVSMLHKPLPLVIVGRKAWLWKEQLAAADRYLGDRAESMIRQVGFVPDEMLGALYEGALALVFPSLYEGFGLPPLEAMRFGCPVIASNVSSLPEVCGDAALYVDPNSPEAIRNAIEDLQESPKQREKMIRAGFGRVDHFSLEQYADRLREAYGILTPAAR